MRFDPMLAQADIGQVPAGFLKDVVIVIVVSAVVMSFILAAIFAGLMYWLERRREQREVRREENPQSLSLSPSPFPVTKVSAPATRADLAEKHAEHERRLNGHDKEIGELWNTMRAEDKEIRAEQANQFQAISKALGRIEGKLGDRS